MANPSSSKLQQRLEAVHAAIARDPEQAPSLVALARSAGISPSQLTRAFTARFGLSPKELTQSLRRDRLKLALRDGDDVTAAIYAAGYGSSSRVYENTARLIGMTPGTYRRGAAGVAIRYTVVHVPLGLLLVATTDRGICSVTLGDDEALLIQQLEAEFPGASCTRVDDGADEWLRAVIARVEAQLGLHAPSATPGPIPADLRATAFQWQVWQALMRIPRGETRSYAQVAQAIGRPTAARAVARACASNRLALVVPCHRVIREDGTLGGYKWGIPRKRALLALERDDDAAHPPANGKRAAYAPVVPRNRRKSALSATTS